MRNTVAICAGALAALACAAAARAHHTGSMYVTTPVWVTGSVVGFESVNPHTITTLEERTEDGLVRRWAVEGPGRAQVARLKLEVPQVGDVVEVCVFGYKSAEELSRLFPGTDFSARRAFTDPAGSEPRFAAGHLIVTADGRTRLWEPHGLIGECIRSSRERRQSWLDFLNADAAARDAWCSQRSYSHVRSTEPLRELVEDINGSIDNPCR